MSQNERNRMKKITCAIILTIFALLAVGCSAQPAQAKPETVLARVNGEEITASQVYATLAAYADKFGMDLEEMQSNKESTTYDDLKKSVLNEEVTKALVRQYAAELGIQITPEQREEFGNRADEYMRGIEKMLRTDVEEQAKEDSKINVDEETKKQYESYLQKNNFTKESAIAELAQYEIEQQLRQKVYETLDDSDAAVKQYFDELVSKQQQTVQESPERFAKMQSSGETYYYYPENAVYAKSLMVEEKDRAALEALTDEQSFDALLETAGIDDGMKVEPYKSEGYLMLPEGGAIPALEEAAMALQQPGELSPVITNGEKFVRLMLVSRPQPGAVDFESVKEPVRAQMMEQQQTDAWNAALDKRREAANIEILDVAY